MRRTDIQRDSRPASHQLFTSAEQKAELEARNGLLQFDEVIRLIKQGFVLRPSILQRLQRLAIQDIYTCAGNYRTGPVLIAGTTHQPPLAHEVPEQVEELCEYVNTHKDRSALHLAAFVMWKVNWIHPFSGGNGRTSRALSYLVLCSRLGYKLPGAGGGGFLYMVAKDPEAAARIKQTLQAHPLRDNARFVEMSLSTTGLQISRS